MRAIALALLAFSTITPALAQIAPRPDFGRPQPSYALPDSRMTGPMPRDDRRRIQRGRIDAAHERGEISRRDARQLLRNVDLNVLPGQRHEAAATARGASTGGTVRVGEGISGDARRCPPPDACREGVATTCCPPAN